MEKIPLVLVQGFMGNGDSFYWNSLIKSQSLKDRKLIIVKLGNFSSSHDRACELFYQLKGGRTDFGYHHSKRCSHKRFGKIYEGLYPQWNEKNRLHFLGHSFGGNTILQLEKMLEIFSFLPYKTSKSWIKSVICFNSPLRGTPLVYLFGYKAFNPSSCLSFSLGGFLYRLIYFITWLNFIIDLQMLQFQNHRKSFYSVIKDMFSINNFQFDKGLDNSVTDMAIEECEKANNELIPNIDTYYVSISCSLNKPTENHILSNKKWIVMPYFAYFAKMISGYRFDKRHKIVSSEEWKRSDGVCPLASQYHPKDCRDSYCFHCTTLDHRIKKGIWNVIEIGDTGHLDIFPALFSFKSNRFIIDECLEILNKIDQNSKK